MGLPAHLERAHAVIIKTTTTHRYAYSYVEQAVMMIEEENNNFYLRCNGTFLKNSWAKK